MADKKIKVQVDVDVNAEPSIAQLKALKKQLKETAAGSDEFKKLYNQIDDLEDKIKGTKAASSDWIDTLESAGGPIGALGAGLNKLKQSTVSFGAALKATGIGLAIAAVGGLVAAFSQVDGATKKLEPLMIGLQKILGGIFEALTPLIDSFVELATKALPYVTEGIKIFYSSLVALFTLVKEGGAGIGKILKGIFTLDKASIEEGYKQLTGTWTKTVEAFDASNKRFDEGYKKKTKIEKENEKDAKERADKALAEKLKRMEAEDKLDEARLAKMKEEALALVTTEEQKLQVEMAFAKKSYELKRKEIEDKQALYKKDSVEYKTLEAEKTQLDADRIGQLTDFGEKQNKLEEDRLKAHKDFLQKMSAIEDASITDETAKARAQRESKYQKDLEDLEADKEFIKLSEEEKFALKDALLRGYNNDLAAIDRDAKIKQYSDDLELLQAQQKTLTEGTQAYLDNSIAIENDAYQIKLANAKGNAKKIQAIETEHEQNIKDIKLKAFIAEKQIQSDRIAVIGSIGQSLGQLAGKNKALAIAAISIEKAAAIGQIWTSNSIANAKAIAASPLTFGQPWVTINTLSAVLGSAAAIASGVKAIQEINAVPTPGGSGGFSGGGGSTSAPAPPTVGTTSAPQIQTTGGQNATAQIGETISRAQSPIKAYVVSGEISSQQALDRRTSVAATFTGG
jgi:hypothetical protein